MKKSLTDLAIFGGEISFADVLPIGQIYLPEWERIAGMCDGVFERHYFTNHGELAQDLEKKLCDYLDVRNAVTLTNESISIMYAVTALGLEGKVLVPALAHPSTVQSLMWSGIESVFCDVDRDTLLLTPELVRPLLEQHSISAVLASHLWGAVCDIDGFDRLAEEYQIPVIYDASHAFGCRSNNNKLVGAGGTAEIFSFNADNVLNAGEGGVVATDDDHLAEKLRNLRSSYGRLKDVDIPVNGNGRFSELQAGFALLSFDDLEKNIEANKKRKLRYVERLQPIRGIDIVFDDVDSGGNHQWIVVTVDEESYGLNRETLMSILKAENIDLDGSYSEALYRCPPYDTMKVPVFPVAESISDSILLLPNGEQVTLECVDLICSVISISHDNSIEIASKLDVD